MKQFLALISLLLLSASAFGAQSATNDIVSFCEAHNTPQSGSGSGQTTAASSFVVAPTSSFSDGTYKRLVLSAADRSSNSTYYAGFIDVTSTPMATDYVVGNTKAFYSLCICTMDTNGTYNVAGQFGTATAALTHGGQTSGPTGAVYEAGAADKIVEFFSDAASPAHGRQCRPFFMKFVQNTYPFWNGNTGPAGGQFVMELIGKEK